MTIEQPLTAALSDAHVEQWRTDGYVIVENFVRPEIVEQTVEQIHRFLPTWEQFANQRDQWPDVEGFQWSEFPYRPSLMNDLVLNPELVSFARRALACDDLILSHSESITKYADGTGFDQPLHKDFGNNSFVVPLADADDQMASITYLTDVTIDLGPTYVVSYQDGAAHDGHDWSEMFTEIPEGATDTERAITVPAGSIFLYTMRTMHRGSAFTATEGLRHSLHVAYQRRSMTWGGWRANVRAARRGYFIDLMSRLTPEQRSLIGFPPIGHDYWRPETIEAMSRRYPDMDLSPYAR